MELLYKFCMGLTTLSGVILGLFVLYKNPRSRINITWVFTNFAVALWALACNMYVFEPSYQRSLSL